jgi:hypothetical protein
LKTIDVAYAGIVLVLKTRRAKRDRESDCMAKSL